jgi:uncharacterized membrane protein
MRNKAGPFAIVFMSFVLCIHLLVMFAGRAFWNASLTRLRSSREDVAARAIDVDTLLVASNACAGGAATAASMAAQFQRTDLTIPATLAGVLGYVIGTPAGLSIGRFLQHYVARGAVQALF